MNLFVGLCLLVGVSAQITPYGQFGRPSFGGRPYGRTNVVPSSRLGRVGFSPARSSVLPPRFGSRLGSRPSLYSPRPSFRPFRRPSSSTSPVRVGPSMMPPRGPSFPAVNTAPSPSIPSSESWDERLPVVDASDSSPVMKLKNLYINDPQFRETMSEMFANLQPSNGSPNPWTGKSMEDLYQFFNEWYDFVPTNHNGLKFILQFELLLYKNPAGQRFVWEEPGLSWTMYFVTEHGKYLDSPESAAVIAQWPKDPSFVTPEGGFESFNDFFTKELAPGARPISSPDDDSIVTAPADGKVIHIVNKLAADTQIPMKGKMTLNVDQLLGGSKYADKFIGGHVISVFLMPDSYHHFHAITSGVVVESKELIDGHLFGMDMPDFLESPFLGVGNDFSVLEHFKSGYFVIKTEKFGYIAMVPVGLQTVGSLNFEPKFKNIQDEEVAITKGEKMGHFKYGGSTVIMLFEKGKFDIDGRMGQQIGHFNP